jgi:hypothetical protein
LAPFSNAYLIDSTAATIRWLLVILPSLIGTLKSTLNSYEIDGKLEKNRFNKNKWQLGQIHRKNQNSPH